MEHTISRYEKILNENGSIKEIFITVKLRIDANDTWEQGYWLTPAEVDSIVIDENNLTEIVDKVAIIAEESYNNSLNIVPEPEPIPEFSVEMFLYRLAEEFDVLQRMNLAGVAPSFTSELQFQNFEGIKEILDYLLSTSEITQETVDKITSLFLEQNVDLNNL